jgi:hypothetical protein
MEYKTGKQVTKTILLVISIITLFLVSCKPGSADNRLLQLETIIGKWEKELRSRPAAFEDLVYIQTDITAYDINEHTFENKYGNLSNRQQIRLAEIRIRFNKLIRKN